MTEYLWMIYRMVLVPRFTTNLSYIIRLLGEDESITARHVQSIKSIRTLSIHHACPSRVN